MDGTIHCSVPSIHMVPVEIENPKNGDVFKVNGQRLKPFWNGVRRQGGNIVGRSRLSGLIIFLFFFLFNFILF
ncbi:hypothetical protein H7U16_27610 [Klebsiella pneumoniae]|uniref:Uncharacterized protein n=1 Tax=Klebsiella pneumoniae TaxID=573 RepID=A0A7X1HUP5_KLEPN|nr:hypothetical protein [Klebsiella pneumoniae]